jgi:hypothetical protein
MTFEEFEHADGEQLRQLAKACYEEGSGIGSWDQRAAKLLEAQFYEQELDRREENRERAHTRWAEGRSFLLEVAVIVLILGEIALSIYGIELAIKQGNDEDALMIKQNAVLEQVERNMAATASLLRAEEETMQATNSAIRAQLARMSQVNLSVDIDIAKKTYTLLNYSASEIQVWGRSFNSKKAVFFTKPMTAGRGQSVSIPADEFVDLLSGSKSTRDTAPTIPVTIFLTDDLGNKFVWRAEHAVTWNDGKFGGITSPTAGVRMEDWSLPAK